MPVMVNSTSPIRLIAELIQCQVWNCLIQKDLRLGFALTRGLDKIGAGDGVKLVIGAARVLNVCRGVADNANDSQLQHRNEEICRERDEISLSVTPASSRCPLLW